MLQSKRRRATGRRDRQFREGYAESYRRGAEDLPADKKNRAVIDLDHKGGAQAVRLITIVEEQERGRSWAVRGRVFQTALSSKRREGRALFAASSHLI